MIAPSMFCPACGGRVVSCVSVVSSTAHCPTPTFAVVCLSCPLVSEVSTLGYLDDLGNGVTLEDLEAPVAPGDDPYIVKSSVTPLRHGRDS